jgi:hypothetical protein
VEILGNNSLFHKMKKAAYEYGRSMIWPKVGQTYWDLFCSQAPSVTIPLRPSVDSQDWTIPTYNRQAIYQSA